MPVVAWRFPKEFEISLWPGGVGALVLQYVSGAICWFSVVYSALLCFYAASLYLLYSSVVARTLPERHPTQCCFNWHWNYFEWSVKYVKEQCASADQKQFVNISAMLDFVQKINWLSENLGQKARQDLSNPDVLKANVTLNATVRQINAFVKEICDRKNWYSILTIDHLSNEHDILITNR